METGSRMEGLSKSGWAQRCARVAQVSGLTPVSVGFWWNFRLGRLASTCGGSTRSLWRCCMGGRRCFDVELGEFGREDGVLVFVFVLGIFD